MLQTPSAVTKSQLTVALSTMLKRLLGRKYGPFVQMTKFGLLSDSQVKNYLSSSSAVPGVQPQQKRISKV